MTEPTLLPLGDFAAAAEFAAAIDAARSTVDAIRSAVDMDPASRADVSESSSAPEPSPVGSGASITVQVNPPRPVADPPAREDLSSSLPPALAMNERVSVGQLCDAIERCAETAYHEAFSDTGFAAVEIARQAARHFREAMYLLREYRSRPHHPSLEVAGYHQLGMIEDDTVQRAFDLLRQVRP